MKVKKARPRNAKGEGTIEKRGPNEFVGYYRVRVNGVRKKVGTCSGATRREVMLQMHQWSVIGGKDQVTAEPTILTGPFLQEWFDSKLPDWAPTTRDTNSQNFAKHVVDSTLWSEPIKGIGYKALMEFKDSIGGALGSSNTKRNVMRLIRPAFDRAVKLEYISKNPFDLLDKADKPRKSVSRIVYFQPDEMQKLLRWVNRSEFDPMWRALVLLGFDLGVEPEEFLGVQFGDINWHTNYIHIQRTVVEAGGEIIVSSDMKAPKRNRDMPLTPITMQALAALVTDASSSTTHVFSPDGQPWSYDAFLVLWRRLLAAAGVKYLPPLAMRHTMATMMLSQGEPLPAVSERLGHSSSVTTLNNYVHIMPHDKARIAAAQGRIFASMLE